MAHTERNLIPYQQPRRRAGAPSGRHATGAVVPSLWLLVMLWPLVCCEICDYAVACITLSIVVSLVGYVVASIVHELRALAQHRPTQPSIPS